MGEGSGWGRFKVYCHEKEVIRLPRWRGWDAEGVYHGKHEYLKMPLDGGPLSYWPITINEGFAFLHLAWILRNDDETPNPAFQVEASHELEDNT